MITRLLLSQINWGSSPSKSNPWNINAPPPSTTNPPTTTHSPIRLNNIIMVVVEEMEVWRLPSASWVDKFGYWWRRTAEWWKSYPNSRSMCMKTQKRSLCFIVFCISGVFLERFFNEYEQFFGGGKPRKVLLFPHPSLPLFFFFSILP